LISLRQKIIYKKLSIAWGKVFLYRIGNKTTAGIYFNKKAILDFGILILLRD